MTFLRSGNDLPSKQRVSRREKIGAGFRIGTSPLLLRISSCFSWIAWYSVPYRTFRTGTLSCSEGKGHTFESCLVRQLFLYFTTRYARAKGNSSSVSFEASKQSGEKSSPSADSFVRK